MSYSTLNAARKAAKARSKTTEQDIFVIYGAGEFGESYDTASDYDLDTFYSCTPDHHIKACFFRGLEL